ncbi:hypothetical protein ACOMCU_00375 [Lysinibacillus sp. UGB7]|uniref:hypothetical protein n=1 Tax=Lysinibacillus sp. UGB7 TaxID=3411039 RepID=UPI003B81E60A
MMAQLETGYFYNVMVEDRSKDNEMKIFSKNDLDEKDVFTVMGEYFVVTEVDGNDIIVKCVSDNADKVMLVTE